MDQLAIDFNRVFCTLAVDFFTRSNGQKLIESARQGRGRSGRILKHILVFFRRRSDVSLASNDRDLNFLFNKYKVWWFVKLLHGKSLENLNKANIQLNKFDIKSIGN